MIHYHRLSKWLIAAIGILVAGKSAPAAPTIIKPTNGQTIASTIACIEWSGDSHTKYQDTSYTPPGADIVEVHGNNLTDHDGPFLGLGATYMSAMRFCKYDRSRFNSDLAFLASKDFNYVRILTMVGWYDYWDGYEIAPVNFYNQNGKFVAAWPDYWQQFRDCIDIIYSNGLRAEVTIFADAQLMPNESNRYTHMNNVLANLTGREHKVIMLEVANEYWQNGFPDPGGVNTVRQFGQYLAERTAILVALSSPSDTSNSGISNMYAGSAADIATVHFSRDISTVEGGWYPVRDCWRVGDIVGIPPVSSNEPIGPGSSVNSENDPIKLVMAAAFAWGANLPMYVFHSSAGVRGDNPFSSMTGVNDYVYLNDILAPDLAGWVRNDGKESTAPFTTYANGQPNKWWTEVDGPTNGVVRNTGKIKGNEFYTFPIGILSGGVELEARREMSFQVYNPLTGAIAYDMTMNPEDHVTLAQGPNAYIIKGIFLDMPGWLTEVSIDLGSPDVEIGMTHPQNDDGDTMPVTIGGRSARRNVNPAEDFYFYFGVSDTFAFRGSRSELYITIEYYDTSAGSLSLQYDSNTGDDLPAFYKDGGSVALTGTNTWMQQTLHITEAYFGNRQNAGADFRIRNIGNLFYLDMVRVSTEQPLPPVISEVTPDPDKEFIGAEYVKSLSLIQGFPLPDWSVLQGPPGVQVSASGRVSGWTPTATDLGDHIFEIQASNSKGSDSEDWIVRVISFKDFDTDGDVDQEDFGQLQACYSGSGFTPKPGCEYVDLDGDLDVDQNDYNEFRNCIGGANNPPGC